MRVSKKFLTMSKIYRIFTKDFEQSLNFDEDALLEMYKSESTGTFCSKTNGFYQGKKWLNLQVNMWKEDIRDRLIYKNELYADNKFPKWWLDSIFKGDI